MADVKKLLLILLLCSSFAQGQTIRYILNQLSKKADTSDVNAKILAVSAGAVDTNIYATHSFVKANAGAVDTNIIATKYFVSKNAIPVGSTALGNSVALGTDETGKIIGQVTTAVELGYVHGVTSAIQAQIGAKADSTDRATRALVNLYRGQDTSRAVIREAVLQTAINGKQASGTYLVPADTNGLGAKFGAKADTTGNATRAYVVALASGDTAGLASRTYVVTIGTNDTSGIGAKFGAKADTTGNATRAYVTAAISGKANSATTLAGYGITDGVSTARTVNAKALSANITLGLASSDFANQGTTTTVLHGNASGNPAFGGIAFADHASSAAATTATTGTMTVTMNTNVVTITPTGACTFNASGGISGQDCHFIITTSGTAAFVLTWSTNFKVSGTLSTGTVSAKVFVVNFVCKDGTLWVETGRTAAM